MIAELQLTMLHAQSGFNCGTVAYFVSLLQGTRRKCTYGESLEGRDDTVGETGDGTLGQIGDDVCNGVGLRSEKVVDFL